MSFCSRFAGRDGAGKVNSLSGREIGLANKFGSETIHLLISGQKTTIRGGVGGYFEEVREPLGWAPQRDTSGKERQLSVTLKLNFRRSLECPERCFPFGSGVKRAPLLVGVVGLFRALQWKVPGTLSRNFWRTIVGLHYGRAMFKICFWGQKEGPPPLLGGLLCFCRRLSGPKQSRYTKGLKV